MAHLHLKVKVRKKIEGLALVSCIAVFCTTKFGSASDLSNTIFKSRNIHGSSSLVESEGLSGMNAFPGIISKQGNSINTEALDEGNLSLHNDVYDCTLPESFRQDIFDDSLNAWIISDDTLSQLDNDIQAVVNCTSEGDTIYFETSRIIRPKRTVFIPWRLTLSKKPVTSLFQQRNIVTTESKVVFTAPHTGDVFVSRTSSLTIANAAFVNCHNHGSIVCLDPYCGSNETIGTTRFIHVNFKNNSISANQAILKTARNVCTMLEMDQIVLTGNKCDGFACILLLSLNTLKNVRIINNRRNPISEMHAVFSAPPMSKTSAKNIFALNNTIRIFFTAMSAMDLVDSSFVKNHIESHRSGRTTSILGSILLSNVSSVSVLNSRFEGNKAVQGAALYDLAASNLTIVSCQFTGNEAGNTGGAIGTYLYTTLIVSNCTFSGNGAQYGAVLFSYEKGFAHISNSVLSSRILLQTAKDLSACLPVLICDESALVDNVAQKDGAVCSIYYEIKLELANCIISNNTALQNGGVIAANSNCEMKVVQCNISGNRAQETGGVVAINTTTILRIVSSFLTGNKADSYGGAIATSTATTVIVKDSFMSNNYVENNGGVIALSMNSHLSVSNCNFSNNEAASRGGAIYTRRSNTKIVRSYFEKNRAGIYGGSICTTDNGQVHLMDSHLVDSEAKYGGALTFTGNSTILCSSSRFENNEAVRGGVMFMDMNDEHSTVAQFTNSAFENNRAKKFGGCFDLLFIKSQSQPCQWKSANCSVIVLLNVSFLKNQAIYSGAVVVTTSLKRIFVSCDHGIKDHSEFWKKEHLKKLTIIDPKKMCDTWKGNSLSTAARNDKGLPTNAIEGVISTYGINLLVNMTESSKVRVEGDFRNRLVIQNVSSGSKIPSIDIIVLDRFGIGPTATYPIPLEIDMTSEDRFFKGNMKTFILDGVGHFSDVVGLQKPGEYYFILKSPSTEVRMQNVTVFVRDCLIGEAVTESNTRCVDCDGVSYNFELQSSNCMKCSKHGDCSGRFIIPEDGYWHRTPCHTKVQRCIHRRVCSVNNRKSRLHNLTTNLQTCNINEAIIEEYNRQLCDEGYKGLLCGNCEDGFGLTSTNECTKCGSETESVFTFFGLLLCLLVLASFTLKGGLNYIQQLTTNEDESPLVAHAATATSSKPEQKALQEDTPSPTEAKTQGLVQSDGASPSIRSIEQHKEDMVASKKRTTEILKILVNYAQVIALAASVNVDWKKAITRIFTTANYVGGMSGSTLTKPVDCLLSSSSASSRPLWRALFGFIIPFSVILFFTISWGAYSMIKKKSDPRFFIKRACLSVIIVIYISYLDLTKVSLKSLNCTKIHDFVNGTSIFLGRRWILQTDTECFKGYHLALTLICVLILVTITVGFPLVIALTLKHKPIESTNDVEYQENLHWIYEVLGFLYKPYKEEFIYWESLIIIRKTCLSVVAVFAYTIRQRSQGLLMALILLISLYVQLTYSPYKTYFNILNKYESLSLLVSSSTFILGQYFDITEYGSVVKFLVALIIILANSAFFLFLLWALFQNLVIHWRVSLKCQNVDIADNAGWWIVGKEYVILKVLSLWKKVFHKTEHSEISANDNQEMLLETAEP